MGVMIQFACPYSNDRDPVTLGPFQEAEITDGTVSGDGVCLGYYVDHEQAWFRDARYYDSVKIFAASSVVPT